MNSIEQILWGVCAGLALALIYTFYIKRVQGGLIRRLLAADALTEGSAVSLSAWRRCRYHLREYAGGSLHSLTLSQGVVLRRVLRISAEDAASVEMERTPLLWLLGGRRIRVNTAGLRRKSANSARFSFHSK